MWKEFGGKRLCSDRGAVLVFTFSFPLKSVYLGPRLTDVERKNVSYSALTESRRIHVYVVQYVIYMVRCDVQRWNMQKQIDATRYIVPYKTDDRLSIIVLRYARRRMRTVSTRSSYAVSSLRVTLSRDFSPERHPAIRHIHVN